MPGNTSTTSSSGERSNLRHSLDQNRQARDSYNSHPPEGTGSLSRVGPACFGPMVRGERYPQPFRAPKEVEKYDPSLDPIVWVDSYLMAMGISGKELLHQL